MSASDRQEDRVHPKANWPKAIAGILFLIAIVSFGALHGMTPERRNMVLSIFRTSSPTPTLTFEQWKDRANPISYKLLARQPDQHEGELVFFQGEVLLILEQENGDAELLVLVNENAAEGSVRNDTLVLHCRDMPYRVATNDTIFVVATMSGISSTHQIPELIAMSLETK